MTKLEISSRPNIQNRDRKEDQVLSIRADKTRGFSFKEKTESKTIVQLSKQGHEP